MASAKTRRQDAPEGQEARAKGEGDVSRSVARALNILLDIAHGGRPQSFTELHRKHRLPKATLHKLLGTLETLNFLRRNPETGKYSIGIATLEISAAAAAAPEDLPSLLAPILGKLVADWNETCHFGVLDGHDDVILQRLDPVEQVVRLGPLRRLRNPAHSTAGGLSMLAAGDTERLLAEMPETLPRSTPHTLGTKRELIKRLEKVRKDGYALDMEEAYQGVRCVAVAVAVKNWPVIYVSFSLPLQRGSVARLRELAEPLKVAAREIERVLGVLPSA